MQVLDSLSGAVEQTAGIVAQIEYQSLDALSLGFLVFLGLGLGGSFFCVSLCLGGFLLGGFQLRFDANFLCQSRQMIVPFHFDTRNPRFHHQPAAEIDAAHRSQLALAVDDVLAAH